MATNPEAAAHHDPAIINIRKLAALDIAFHGPAFILGEFIFGVFASAAFGFGLLYLGISVEHFSVPWTVLLGGYICCLALNYVPLLLYTISITRRKSAQEEVALELTDKAYYGRKYTMQSLLILLPLVVPAIALAQEWQKKKAQTL
jgi:membrane protein implicated in regulation of membrane protease activity